MGSAGFHRDSAGYDLCGGLRIGEDLPHRRPDVRQTPKLERNSQSDEGLQDLELDHFGCVSNGYS
ncbi:hypothetical protein D3C85_1605510 [compost metagenome]